MSDDARLPFVIQGHLNRGLRTYLCPTAEWALRKLRDFKKAGYANIIATGPDGPLTEGMLIQLVKGETKPSGGAPVDVDAPSAPALAA